jgi:hypothetical protein
MPYCDRCHKTSGVIQRCAFGPVGVTLFFHPICELIFSELEIPQQDAALLAIGSYNHRRIGTDSQSP